MSVPPRVSPRMVRLAYGPDPNQWVEFRRPRVDGSVPLVVHLHGGFWSADYALDHARPFCAGLRRSGVATCNVEYRRVGQAGGGWPGTFDDARDALAVVGRLVRDHDVDPARVVLTGHSAGGHLGLWAAGHTDVTLSGVVPIGAVTDLRAAHERKLSDRGTATSELVGCLPEEDPGRYARASPIDHVPLPMPIVFVHGRDDRQVPQTQATDYADASRARGGDVRVDVVDGDHFAVLDPTTPMFRHVSDVVWHLVGGRP